MSHVGFTQDQLKRLDDAIAQGITKVTYADRHISYRSLDEMLKVRELMKRSLARPSETHSPCPRQRVVMSFSKGFE